MPGKKKILPDTDGLKMVRLFEQYAPALKRYLTLRMKNAADAQDIAQEAYLRLSRVSNPELIRKPEAYLFRIASNLAGEYLLRQSQNPDVESLDDLEGSAKEQADTGFAESLEHRQAIKRLEQILNDMPPLYRAVLLLRKRDGYSHQEIAERLDISPQTVHTYLKRALVQCRANWPE